MTSKLTDMQLVLLATACQRDDGSLLPPPAILGAQGGRIRRAVAALIKRLLAGECDMTDATKAWRDDGDRHIGVVITDAGRAIIAAEEQASASGTGQDVPTEKPTTDAALPAELAASTDTLSTDTAPVARAATKQALVLDMLRQDGGANLDELVAATGWLPHTTRAALAGLRKKGHVITLVGERGASRYQLAAA